MAAAATAAAAAVNNSLASSASIGSPSAESLPLAPSPWLIKRSVAASKHSCRLVLSESSKLLWWTEASEGEDITVVAYDDDGMFGVGPIPLAMASTLEEVQSD